VRSIKIDTINNENKKENIDKGEDLKKNACLTAVLGRQIETVHLLITHN